MRCIRPVAVMVLASLYGLAMTPMPAHSPFKSPGTSREKPHPVAYSARRHCE